MAKCVSHLFVTKLGPVHAELVVDYIPFTIRRLLRLCRQLYSSGRPQPATQSKVEVPNASQDYIMEIDVLQPFVGPLTIHQ